MYPRWEKHRGEEEEMRNHRPNILKLATKISMESLTYTGITYNDPEYRILEPIIDDEM